MTERRTLVMASIEEGDIRGRTVLSSLAAPVIFDDDPVDHQCGSCGVVLVEGMAPHRLLQVVVRCPVCRAWNETRPSAVG